MSLKIALISTNENLLKLFPKLAKEKGFIPITKTASLTHASKIAFKLQDKVDAIISRGATSDYIKETVNIPSVSIKVTRFDTLRAIFTAKKLGNKIALITYKRSILNKAEIENMLDVQIEEFMFSSEQEISSLISKVKNKNIKIVVSGKSVTDEAISRGLYGETINSGEEALRQAIEEALNLIEVRNIELRRAARFKAILDAIGEGIIVTDQFKKITTYNNSINKIFIKAKGKLLGKPIESVIPNYKIDNILKTGEPETKIIKNLHGLIIAANQFPVKVEDKLIGVVNTFEDVTKIQTLEKIIRKKIHEKGFVAKYNFSDILTENKNMLELKKLAVLYSKTDSSVLIQGESGTGKELFAQSIHNSSPRKNGPFVAINCAALPEHLLESELFGYEGGSFTGAKKEGKPGLFELAHTGTIFLDEIGELSKPLQAQLLRVLEEKEIMHIGGDKIIPVDIRIISSTNRNLLNSIENGTFREDLYYRLNVFNLTLPPLRSRGHDVEILAAHFLENTPKFSLNRTTILKRISPTLMSYNWPGNTRELSNVMERIALFIDNDQEINWSQVLNSVIHGNQNNNTLTLKVPCNLTLKEITAFTEKNIINNLLEKYNNDHNKVAEILNIARTTLWRKK
ncbi:sigma-54-dependent Fis family transcriptional regulator [Clostridium felsineum]|uniref:sigma-54 interaction domain-containing protein n=1 Tax=Clostridium felsineum TaxID=36839 RepID=UPI00098C28CC|nr:sigma-54-dependent Fis family transcriptional regulator [Clostridium felsineum]MCR3761373.1 sigma-54-dependent Fis family transcriptional regulator [Clostridium felsineum]URZ18008.1 Anaerobic nitric oxide reductase transcription regulator NorR [Clostridium felsineum DSM 794]